MPSDPRHSLSTDSAQTQDQWLWQQVDGDGDGDEDSVFHWHQHVVMTQFDVYVSDPRETHETKPGGV